jgi:hypothetical protein
MLVAMSTNRTHGRRRAGSVRFDPYIKIQWWIPRNVSWRDVQRRFDTVADAITFAIGHVDGDAGPDNRFRLMSVTMDGRGPVGTYTAVNGEAVAE